MQTAAANRASADLDQSPGGTVSRASRARLMGYAWIVLLLFGLLAVAFLSDNAVDQFAREHRNPTLKSIASIVSKLGVLPWVLFLAFLVLVWGLIRGNKNLKKLAFALALSSTIAGTTATAIRCMTGRTRPSSEAVQGWYGMRHDSQWLVGKYQFSSFPSGHVGTVVGFTVPLFLASRRWRVPAILYAVAMGWSRIYLGCHHLSDVFVAALIGIAVGWYTWHRIAPRFFRTDGSPSPAQS